MCRFIPGPYVRESGFQDLGNFLLWNLESWALESGIQLKKIGNPINDCNLYNDVNATRAVIGRCP